MSDTYEYLHIGRASDLKGSAYLLYRFFEMLPALLSIGTIALFVVLSLRRPDIAAYLTILFSMYWLMKTTYLSMHLRHNFRRIRHNMQVDWNDRLKNMRHEQYSHVVLIPFFDESEQVITESVRAIAESRFDPQRVILVLAAEARAPQGERVARAVEEKFKGVFMETLVTVHPDGIVGELAGKGSNLSYAAEQLRTQVLDPRGIAYDTLIVSAFDSDTVIYPDYFACLTWYVCASDDPLRTSFQPVPLYNNNIWDVPALSRVIAYSSSFWQMIQQERPEKLATFSSHAVMFKSLFEAGYWQRNVVSEDSRIFWNLFVRYDGRYKVTPMAYPVSMDANAAPTFFATVRNIYKQHRRWTYGAENIAYILYAFIQNPRIPLGKRIKFAFYQIEGFWSLTTHPLILLFVGWLPLFIGGPAFNASVLSYNLPSIARSFLTITMLGLVVSAAICMYLLPERPKGVSRRRSVAMVVQWILVPFTMVAFSSIPGLESQLRLLFGNYLGFWVTPKLSRAGGGEKSALT